MFLNNHIFFEQKKLPKKFKMSRNMNEAVMSGNMQEIQMRINMGEDVNQCVFPRYTTPLHDAVTCGRTEIARLLIKM